MRNRKKKEKEEIWLSCPNSRLGCKVKVRSDECTHAAECPYRFVHCEACGRRLLLSDLYTHQRLKGCYEIKLKQEVVSKKRQLRQEVVSHQMGLQMDYAHREMQKNKDFRLRLHDKMGYSPRVPSARSSRSCSISSQSEKSSSSNSPNVTSHDVTSQVVPYGSSDRESHLVNGSEIEVCGRCDRSYKLTSNTNTACCWHKGVSNQTLLLHKANI